MITAKLISHTNKDAPSLMSFSARTCYDDSEPIWGKSINIEKSIFNTVHHTVLQSSEFTFFIEGVAISNVTFGLHLNSPFYTTSQRSGRFCFGMFSDPDIAQGIIDYVKYFFPQTDTKTIRGIENYINFSQELFNQNIDPATKVAEKFIAKERPKATTKYIKQNARKFGQEQLRVLIPTIFPTALTYTVNLSALVALYRSAWDSPMYYVTDLMAQEVLKLYPELQYMFKREEKSSTDISPLDLTITVPSACNLENSPKLKLLSIDNLDSAVYPEPTDTHPVDTLHFNPKFMPNNVIDIKTQIEISVATMGQDQRHRRINRGPFDFTGGFYHPPIVRELNINKELMQIAEMWLTLSTNVHPALFRFLSPYGAMVRYIKKGTLNTVLHEQDKRLCWCTQEEIYNLSRLLREAILPKSSGQHSVQLLNMLSPKCYQCGQCAEGKRYCGRDSTIPLDQFFPVRLV